MRKTILSVAGMFQSLTRDSNHSNARPEALPAPPLARFNPSRGIAIIQTRWAWGVGVAVVVFQSLTRDSNHSNFWTYNLYGRQYDVSIPHAG